MLSLSVWVKAQKIFMDAKTPATENDIVPHILAVGNATEPFDRIEEAR